MAQSRAEGKVARAVLWMTESGEEAFSGAGVYRRISCYILSPVPSGWVVPWFVMHHSSETQ